MLEATTTTMTEIYCSAWDEASGFEPGTTYTQYQQRTYEEAFSAHLRALHGPLEASRMMPDG